jgi:hypothetical protein
VLVGRGRVSNISLRRRRGEDLGVRVWLISDISFSLGDICWKGGVQGLVLYGKEPVVQHGSLKKISLNHNKLSSDM